MHMDKESSTGQKWTNLSELSPKKRITISIILVLEAEKTYNGFHVHQGM